MIRIVPATPIAAAMPGDSFIEELVAEFVAEFVAEELEVEEFAVDMVGVALWIWKCTDCAM